MIITIIIIICIWQGQIKQICFIDKLFLKMTFFIYCKNAQFHVEPKYSRLKCKNAEPKTAGVLCLLNFEAEVPLELSKKGKYIVCLFYT